MRLMCILFANKKRIWFKKKYIIDVSIIVFTNDKDIVTHFIRGKLAPKRLSIKFLEKLIVLSNKVLKIFLNITKISFSDIFVNILIQFYYTS